MQQLLAIPGLDVNARDDSGCTALHAAAAAGSSNMVTMLLANKRVGVSLESAKGSPLVIALSCSPGAPSIDIVAAILIAHGASLVALDPTFGSKKRTAEDMVRSHLPALPLALEAMAKRAAAGRAR